MLPKARFDLMNELEIALFTTGNHLEALPQSSLVELLTYVKILLQNASEDRSISQGI